MNRFYLLVFVLTAGTYIPAMPARAADCPPMPVVDWWTYATHDRMISFVERKYRGDWKAYIAKWETQRKFLKGVQKRGTRVVFKKLKVTLSGDSLADYVSKVDQRISVARCLAQLAGAAGQRKIILTPGYTAIGRSKAAVLGCVKCHGVAGTSDHPIIPDLAGQPEFYLQVQLLRFRASMAPINKGEGLIASRHDRIMSPPARKLTDAEIRNISAYFAELICESAGGPGGDAPDAFAPCTECHGAGGMSEDPHIPHLAGQKKDYLARQLKLFRATGKDIHRVDEEETRYHHAMAQHWAALADDAIDSLAAYLSALPCR